MVTVVVVTVIVVTFLGEVWLCCGERQIGKVCIVSSTGENGFDTNSPSLNVREHDQLICVDFLLRYHVP